LQGVPNHGIGAGSSFSLSAGLPHRADIPTLESQLLPGRIEGDEATDRIVTF
jgi:hypothetical protein